jgi:hypothetical protein
MHHSLDLLDKTNRTWPRRGAGSGGGGVVQVGAAQGWAVRVARWARGAGGWVACDRFAKSLLDVVTEPVRRAASERLVDLDAARRKPISHCFKQSTLRP